MEKIAVVGLSCLFPGAQTLDQFWQNLINQRNLTSRATEDQIGVDPEVFYDPEKGKPDYYYCLNGGFIKEFSFDPTGYHIPADLLTDLDDIFKWSLYVARQALEDSGYLSDPAIRSRTGLILGNLSSPTKLSQRLVSPIYRQAVNSAVQELLQQPDFHLGNLSPAGGVNPLNMLTAGYPATIAAQALALGGTSFALDAACASSLYAMELACHYLLSGKADLMLAGAVSCSDPFVTHMAFSTFQAYPNDGIGRPLDKTSTGLLTGEGAGMLALKRYQDAVRDGDKIYATILGVGVSNDGKGKHFLSPSSKGQVLAFERAYANANIDPRSIEYVECHATGTDLGDKTELNSMDRFFGPYDTSPRIGSVKSNLGHLLTAAGMPSLLKVILSMANGVIPPTINVREPLGSANNVIGPEQVVNTLTPWSSQSPIKRAAVSAFGFGGTNAHLVLEEGDAQPAIEPATAAKPAEFQPMAIIGMDAFFGECTGLDAFDRSIYDGKQHFVPLPQERWKGIEDEQSLLKAYGFLDGQAPKGAYIQDFEIDFLRFKIPPYLPDQPIPQQLLILKVADAALRDAGLKEGGNVAVIIAMETDLSSHLYRARCDAIWQVKAGLAETHLTLPEEKVADLENLVQDSLHFPSHVNRGISYVGNIMASRISAAWDFTGPSLTLSSGENGTFKALEVAQILLAEGKVDAVVVGAVDLAGHAENVLLRHQLAQVNTGTPTLGFDHQSNGWMIGEGAGAIVLKRLDTAKQDQDRIYATIDAVSLVQETAATPESWLPQHPTAATIAEACQQAFQQAQVNPDQISYLEVFGSGIPQEDEAEISGLCHAYRTGQTDLSCGIGSVKANIGHSYAASGIASLIKTALCLYHRYIPVTPQWTAPKHPDLWQDSPFYVASDSRLWPLRDDLPKRIAAINSLGGLDGSCAHAIVSEEPTQLTRSSRYLEQAPCSLFLIAADDRSALFEQLQALEQTIAECSSLKTAASQTFAAFQQRSGARYVVALVGHTKEEVQQEIQRAFQGVEKALDQGREWQTPQGSYFTAKPLGKQGTVTLVYPGAFTSYLGLGRDVCQLFPEVYDDLMRSLRIDSSQHVKRLLYSYLCDLYPRSLNKLSRRQLEKLETEFTQNAWQMMLSGVISAVQGTAVLRDHFKIQPQSALGYSLGELSMMFALKVWADVDGIAGAIDASPLFKTQIGGPKNAIRQYWGLPPSEEDADDAFWSNYVLLAPATDVMKALKTEERVYLTHINTPQEVVLAGDQQGCLRVIEKLQCNYFPMPVAGVLHCEPIHSEFNRFKQWATLPVYQRPPLKFYSAANYAQLDQLESEEIGHSIATALCQPCDFPRLVQHAYNDGARIFIEVGPASTCCRWIRETLKQQEHLVVPADVRGVELQASIVRLLAKLLSHQVPLDVSSLFTPLPQALSTGKSLIKTVTIGGCRIKESIVTPSSRERFAGQCVAVTSTAAPVEYQLVASGRATHPVTASVVEGQKSAPAVAVIAKGSTSAGAISAPLPSVPRSTGLPPTPVNRSSPAQPNSSPSIMTSYQPPSANSQPPESLNSSIPSDAEEPDQSSLDSKAVPSIADHAGISYQTLMQHASQVTRSNLTFLRSRQASLRQMGETIELHLAIARQMLESNLNQTDSPPDSQATEQTAISPSVPPIPYSKPAHIVFDEAEVLELACGKLSNVFGKEYEIVDSYEKCTRIPMPPYLFISRVTQLEAKRGCFEPSWVETEYDVPHDAWYAQGNSVPCGILIESSHSNIFLMSYLGIDFETKGQRVYRALGGSITFMSKLPRVGEMLRCLVKVHSFTRLGETLIFSFTHDCFVGDRQVLRMEGRAGFFSAADLQEGGQGVTLTKLELQARSKIQKQSFTPLLRCHKSFFDKQDMQHLSDANLAACFGSHYDQQGKNPLLRLPPTQMRMIDRVISVDPTGGTWGLGLLVAEKDLKPEDWYFNCHFKDDFCMPGTVIGEGYAQLQQFYVLYLGLQTRTTNAGFQPTYDEPQVGRYRGQVTPTSGTLTYRLEVTEIGLEPNPYIKTEASVIFRGKTITMVKNLGAQLIEEDA